MPARNVCQPDAPQPRTGRGAHVRAASTPPQRWRKWAVARRSRARVRRAPPQCEVPARRPGKPGLLPGVRARAPAGGGPQWHARRGASEFLVMTCVKQSTCTHAQARARQGGNTTKGRGQSKGLERAKEKGGGTGCGPVRERGRGSAHTRAGGRQSCQTGGKKGGGALLPASLRWRKTRREGDPTNVLSRLRRGGRATRACVHVIECEGARKAPQPAQATGM